jgi:hypothetical protein
VRTCGCEFSPQGATSPVSGACCSCCCCLHWLGAIAGAAIAMPTAWRSARNASFQPEHPRMRRVLLLGMTMGFGASVGMVFLFIALASLSVPGLGDLFVWPIIVLGVFLPSLFFVPPGLGMMLAARWLQRTDPMNDRSAMDLRGAFCPRCRYDLRASINAGQCPECGLSFTPDDLLRGVDYGHRVAWRVTWVSALYSTLLSALGWGAMVFLALLMR